MTQFRLVPKITSTSWLSGQWVAAGSGVCCWQRDCRIADSRVCAETTVIPEIAGSHWLLCLLGRACGLDYLRHSVHRSHADNTSKPMSLGSRDIIDSCIPWFPCILFTNWCCCVVALPIAAYIQARQGTWVVPLRLGLLSHWTPTL